jgi:hypothetical protein
MTKKLFKLIFDGFNNVLDELNLMLEEETKRNAKFFYKGDIEIFA